MFYYIILPLSAAPPSHCSPLWRIPNEGHRRESEQRRESTSLRPRRHRSSLSWRPVQRTLVHIYIYIYTYICICIYIYIFTWTFIWLFTYTYIHKFVCDVSKYKLHTIVHTSLHVHTPACPCVVGSEHPRVAASSVCTCVASTWLHVQDANTVNAVCSLLLTRGQVLAGAVHDGWQRQAALRSVRGQG